MNKLIISFSPPTLHSVDRPGQDADGSVMETLSKKWRDISYNHPDITDSPRTADAAGSHLTAGPTVDDLFAIERDEDAYSQVSASLGHLLVRH